MNTNGFSKESKDLIAKYEAHGWTFRLSSKGHAIGQAPDEMPMTCSVPRKMLNGRTGGNCEADYERNMREQTLHTAANAMSKKGRAEIAAGLPHCSDPADETIARGMDKKARELFMLEENMKANEITEYALEALTAPEEKRPHSTTALAVGITVQGKFRIVAYECVKCSQRFDKARGVGQHSRTCNGQGNVAQTNRKPDGAPRLKAVASTPGPDTTVKGDALVVIGSDESGHVPALEQDIPAAEQARTPDMSALSVPKFQHPEESNAIQMIREIVAPDLMSIIADKDAEIARLAHRLDRVCANLEAIQSMVGEIRRDES